MSATPAGPLVRLHDLVVDREGFAVSRESHRTYRLLYVVAVLLLQLPDATWTSGMPEGLWRPPPGPLALLSAPPPAVVVWALQAGLLVALVAFAAGRAPRPAAWGVAVLGVVLSGLTYSFGKIDHDILVWLAPVLLEEVGRGGTPAARGLARQALAVTIGAAMLTAAYAKARSGWLDPSTAAARGHLVRNVVLRDRDLLLAPLAVRVSGPAWELVDWATIGVETAGAVAWLRARAFALVLVGLVGFHLGVLLVLNIAFIANIIVYGAFVPWDRLLPGRLTDATSRLGTPRGLAALGVAATVAMAVRHVGQAPAAVVAAASFGLPELSAEVVAVGLAGLVGAVLVAGLRTAPAGAR